CKNPFTVHRPKGDAPKSAAKPAAPQPAAKPAAPKATPKATPPRPAMGGKSPGSGAVPLPGFGDAPEPDSSSGLPDLDPPVADGAEGERRADELRLRRQCAQDRRAARHARFRRGRAKRPRHEEEAASPDDRQVRRRCRGTDARSWRGGCRRSPALEEGGERAQVEGAEGKGRARSGGARA